ncbi:FkbM family methyltransferase [Campylobacter sp. FU_497]|uniref:FkbM family methyltransferase n=1 Tax=Campylobacter sp. FU_497 TaxID=2911610 RepID=UPI0021E6B4E9|nr:FkbM family methyltransferase [Campylobacter sp. FU_497]MCV3463664.1 FkbM family methyltransferase [Campylobacter sp. FU_497]
MINWISKKYQRLLKSIIKKKNFLLFYKLYKKRGYFGYSLSQYNQDLFVRAYYANKKPKKSYFFIDIGSNDGYTLSNTYALEHDNIQNWRGILIEADEKVFKKSIEYRPNTDKYNVALCNTDGEVQFMAIRGGAQMLSGIVDEYCKEHLERIHREIKQDGGSYEIIKIQGAKFETIMKNYPQIQEIDYMSIDVEGGEMKILESIDFQKYKINLIGIEDNYPQTSGIKQFLTKKGYKKIASMGCDTFFERIK